MMAMEDRVGDINQRVMTHDAVCIERQKMVFNTMAAIDGRLQALASAVDDLNRRFVGYHTAIIGGMFVVILSLLSFIWVHR